MTYYTKIEKDDARKQHIKKMEKVSKEMNMCIFDTEKYSSLYAKLRFMEKQLKLYDEIMGYKKEL